ncbi:YncE family protein [Actinoplanes sp. NPDC004185]
MRATRNRILAAAAAAALSTVFGIAAAGPAAAEDNTVPLALPAYGDLAVDQDHDQLYITGGPSANGVVVTDMDGHYKKTITGQYGATGLALNHDNHKLYVALAAGDAISVIDTHTLKEIDRYSTGARTCPTHLVRAGERLWFGHGCDGTWSGGVGRVTFPEPEPDPSTSPSASPSRTSSPAPSPSGPYSPSPTPSRTPSSSPSPSPEPEPDIDLNTQGSVRFQRAPLLAAHNAATGPLVAAQLNLSQSTVYIYDISDNGALSTKTSGTAPGSNLNDISIDKYGQTLLTGAGSRNATQAYATADLSGRGSYYTGYYPTAVAAAPDDYHVANGVRATGDDIYIYETGGVVPEARIDISTDVLVPRGLVWSPDSTHLYAITAPPAGGAPTLHVIHDPV